ncbi:acetyl-CoA synthetase-like protein [Xylaria sp. FL1042]|nr:acetyl-CoA synthetase-like protein [Xylaria sp. FL1042]
MRKSENQQYGRRLMPCVLDHLARTVPSKLFAAIPRTGDLSDGFQDVSVSEVAQCVHFVAHWIEDCFGRSENFETLGYLGIPDLRGIVIFYAAVKCGYKLLIPSPRNPPTTNISLMQQTLCTKLVHAAEVAPLTKPLVGLDRALHAETIPSFAQMLGASSPPYAYEKDFDTVENDPILVLHSSGSTGLPKPIVMTHGSFAVMDNEKNLAEIPGRKRRDWSMWNFDGEARVFSVFPFFHLGGFMALAFNPVLNNASPILSPPFMLPDANLLRTVRRHHKLRSIILPPSIVEQVLQEPDGIDLFRDIDFLVTSGAPISSAIGDRLSSVVEIRQPFGVTEAFLIPELDPGRQEWAYHEWNPNYKHEMQLYDANEQTYELVVLAGESNKHTTAVYHNLPGITEFHTKDLFTRHPQKPNLYKYYGRRDDIIVLANGHKLNPLPLESDLASHPDVKGAIVVGNRRPHTVLLVEPRETLGDISLRNDFLNRLWPSVETGNTLIAGQGRVQRGHVICATPERPFVRTGKGTTVRRLSEDLYKDEIENLYSGSLSSQEQPVTISLKPILKPVYELSAVTRFLREVVSLSFAPGASIGEDDDFFGYGLDSMQTLAIVSDLRRHLKSVTSEPVTWITPRTVFYNPSLIELSRLLTTFLNEGVIPEDQSHATTVRAIDETVKRHVNALPRTSSHLLAEGCSTIALIGSTGYVGIHMLLTLLKSPDVSRIYCLDRSGDAQRRQEASLLQMLSKEEIQPLLGKLEYMTVTLGQPRLGLTEPQYNILANDVHVIVYNAWRLDFGLSLRSFEPFLQATRDIIELAASGTQISRVLFVSSLSSVGNLAAVDPSTAPPEAPVHDALAPLRFGYAQSKHVAERIMAAACTLCGIPISTVRVGQVGGSASESGSPWPEQRWISALLRTAKTIGFMPTHVALIDWVPVETVAAVLSSLIIRPAKRVASEQEMDVFHVYPSQPLPPWEILVEIMCKTYGVTETLPLPEWIKRLRSISEHVTPDDLEKMPALKVLDFYEASGDGLENVRVITERTLAVSGVDIQPANEQLVTRWLRDWNL